MLLLQFVAKKLDKRLLDLGARSLIERGLGDDQHPSGYDSVISNIQPNLFFFCIFWVGIENWEREYIYIYIYIYISSHCGFCFMIP